jgi:hypothetical protein
MEGEWVDFRAVKAAVTIDVVLDRYGVVLKKSGNELRGKCPIHRGSNNKHFTANISKNVFKCFFAQCGTHGNVLNFVAAMEHCSVREAAVKLKDWFKVGDATERSKRDFMRQEKMEIKKGIYSDDNGASYEIIGTATHAERSEWQVVYRELFGQYRLLVTSVERFCETSGPSGQPHFTLVKNL